MQLLTKVIIVLSFCGMWSCAGQDSGAGTTADQNIALPETELAQEVINETLRSWQAYKQYAWGDDVLKPLSKGASNWYEEPLYISPIDAY
ncbi:MAG: glycoside hydrolase family 47 protein, partial [Phaeodactylibacter sp.]|nr:glycoside hydrolase family 47 protein [Phaeodactylibacter sp.]